MAVHFYIENTFSRQKGSWHLNVNSSPTCISDQGIWSIKNMAVLAEDCWIKSIFILFPPARAVRRFRHIHFPVHAGSFYHVCSWCVFSFRLFAFSFSVKEVKTVVSAYIVPRRLTSPCRHLPYRAPCARAELCKAHYTTCWRRRILKIQTPKVPTRINLLTGFRPWRYNREEVIRVWWDVKRHPCILT